MWERTRTRTGIEFREKKFRILIGEGGNSRCVCVRFFSSRFEGGRRGGGKTGSKHSRRPQYL